MSVTIMKKQKITKFGWGYLKTWVGIFWVGIFRMGVFLLSLLNMLYTSFDWYLCRILYKKNCYFTKKSLIPLSPLCKLYHETDYHRFDEYEQSHCGITLGPQSN